jgi:hypothetical protein
MGRALKIGTEFNSPDWLAALKRLSDRGSTIPGSHSRCREQVADRTWRAVHQAAALRHYHLAFAPHRSVPSPPRSNPCKLKYGQRGSGDGPANHQILPPKSATR